jgi:putative transcriptional regulator
LNNYAEIDLHKIDSNFPDINAKIGFGGPVSKDSLFFIHSLGAKVDNCLKIQKELYYGGDFDQICCILKENPEAKDKIRFFIGYSGWDKEQLETEIKENSWITVNNVNHKLILDTKLDDLWKTTLEMQQGKFKMISKFPNNPNDN